MTVCGTMWDSASSSFPPHPALRALYVNGKFAQLDGNGYGRGRVYIDVTGAAPDAASWLDVETGDATPADVPGWLDRREMHGVGGIYCDRANLQAVEQAAGDRHHLLWVATLDGTLDVQVPGTGRLVAVQAIGARMLGFNADLSLVVSQLYWEAHAVGASG